MYPGTFDPITRGHEELVRRCVRLFDRVVVAIAASPRKAPLFPLDERVELAREVLRDLPEVSVTGYTGLTVDFARENGLKAIIRGLRAPSDEMRRAPAGAPGSRSGRWLSCLGFCRSRSSS